MTWSFSIKLILPIKRKDFNKIPAA